MSDKWIRDRLLAVSRTRNAGIKVTEPDTVWGTGPGNVPAVNGIAGMYMAMTYEDGVKKISMPESPAPFDRNYRATKFDDELSDRIFTGNIMPDDIGSVDEMGYYQRVVFHVDDYLEFGFIMAWDGPLPYGCVFEVNDQGFVSTSWFDTEEECDRHWNNILDAYHEYWRQDEEVYTG